MSTEVCSLHFSVCMQWKLKLNCPGRGKGSSVEVLPRKTFATIIDIRKRRNGCSLANTYDIIEQPVARKYVARISKADLFHSKHLNLFSSVTASKTKVLSFTGKAQLLTV